MAKYDIDAVVKIDGKAQPFCCCCPDEGCYLDCVRAVRQAFEAVDTHRRGAAHQGGRGVTVSFEAAVTCDGAPHFEGCETFHDVPPDGVKAIQAALSGLRSHHAVAAALRP